MSFSARNNELVTGSLDGTFMVRSGDILSQIKSRVQTQNTMNKGVSTLVASNLGKRVITAGNDGSLFVWTLEKINLTTGYIRKEQLQRSVHKHIETKGAALEPYHVILEK
jgi:WD40 repeat protein